MGTFIGTIIFGAVIGALARLVLPGKQRIGILMTIVLGVVGALIGYFLWGLINGEGFAIGSTTSGIDWIRWVISIAVAALLIGIYAGSTGRRSIRR